MDKTLLDILACPSCKSSLSYDKQAQELICTACQVAYPIRDDIPVMLADEARNLAGDQ
jgi:LSD1 subclass zinc finger protein